MNNQEQFWQGKFGDEYTERNVNYVENNYQLFEKIFVDELNPYRTAGYFESKVKSIIEFGAGSGQNILALQKIFPDARYTAIEINETAIKSFPF